MEQQKMLDKLSRFKPKDDISLTIYEGYDSIHIDVGSSIGTIAWLTVENGEIKICKFDDNASYSKEYIAIVKTIVKIAKFIEVESIYGRIIIKNEDVCNLFTGFGFSWEEVYDKQYRTAKVRRYGEVA